MRFLFSFAALDERLEDTVEVLLSEGELFAERDFILLQLSYNPDLRLNQFLISWLCITHVFIAVNEVNKYFNLGINRLRMVPPASILDVLDLFLRLN